MPHSKEVIMMVMLYGTVIYSLLTLMDICRSLGLMIKALSPGGPWVHLTMALYLSRARVTASIVSSAGGTVEAEEQ